MKVHGLVAIAILTLLPAFAIAADVLPPAQLPESGGGPAPGIPPKRPSESGVPAIPPSHIDPGIQHTPEKRGDPRGSATAKLGNRINQGVIMMQIDAFRPTVSTVCPQKVASQ